MNLVKCDYIISWIRDHLKGEDGKNMKTGLIGSHLHPVTHHLIDYTKTIEVINEGIKYKITVEAIEG